jgi:hypothetical protein
MPQSHLILYLEQKIMTSFYYLGIQKISKIILYLLFKKKNRNRFKPTGFGSVRFSFLGQKPVQTSLARFFSVFFGLDSI